jgi:hypothetical protein
MNSSIKEKSSAGVVYILTNEAMPGYVKIGKTTTSVEQRILELSRSSAVPLPFECYYAAKVSDVSKVEEAFHDAFGDHRINPRREFFSIAPERIVAILKLLAIEEVTPSRNIGVESKEDAVAIERARKKRASFNFKMVDIPIGAELKFIRDENISCRVSPDQKHVEFEGKTTSLSAAAQKALNVEWPAQGPMYWTYEGEILDERRMRMEEDDEPTPDEIEAAGDQWMSLQADIARGK